MSAEVIDLDEVRARRASRRRLVLALIMVGLVLLVLNKKTEVTA